MRALLVVNQQATTTSERSRDVLIRALRTAADLQVAYTGHRGHASALAREAADEVSLVVVHGGDGTVNEVVNGLMAVGTGAADRPALAVVPGGSTNVFARALGLPGDWVEATGAILEALRDDRGRTIGLGRADDRYFTFCAGLGLDAAVVRRVEQARHRKRQARGKRWRLGPPPTTTPAWGTANPSMYVRATFRQLLFTRGGRTSAITLDTTADEQPELDQLATVVVQNTAPWTYLAGRPIDPNPGASFDQGLDVLALRALRVPSTARTFGQMLLTSRGAHGRQVVRWHDLGELTLRAAFPHPFQVDGEYLGERDKVQFVAVPDALRVLC